MTSEISLHPALSRTMQGGDMLQADEVVAIRRLILIVALYNLVILP